MPKPIARMYSAPPATVVERGDGALMLLDAGHDPDFLPERMGRVTPRGRVRPREILLSTALLDQLAARGHAVALGDDRIKVQLELRRQARNLAQAGYRRAAAERRSRAA